VSWNQLIKRLPDALIRQIQFDVEPSYYIQRARGYICRELGNTFAEKLIPSQRFIKDII